MGCKPSKKDKESNQSNNIRKKSVAGSPFKSNQSKPPQVTQQNKRQSNLRK